MVDSKTIPSFQAIFMRLLIGRNIINICKISGSVFAEPQKICKNLIEPKYVEHFI